MSRLLFLALALPGVALAYESEPQDLLFSDAYDVFSSVEWDSGWLPYDCNSSPAAVKFYVDSRGAAYTEMEGTSHLTWPEALTQRIEGIPGSGWFALHTDLVIGADYCYDVWGYAGMGTLWSEELNMSEDVTFDPFLLAGNPLRTVEVATRAEDYPPFEYSYAVVPGVEIVMSMTWFPQARAALTGKRIETGDALITQENAEILLDVPEENPGLLQLASVYYADIDAALDLVLQPGLSLHIPVAGTLNIGSFDIPIELAAVSEERAFPVVEYEHPLPSLENMIEGYDFGEVELGNLSNAFVDFSNIGFMDLEAWVSIEGSDAFTVYPEYVHATRGNIDGVVVTYAPEDADVQSAMLVVESNDPMRPRIEIPLGGNGFVDDTPCYGEGEQDASLSSCGCSAGGGASGLGWILLAGIGALVRRRRAL